MAAAEAAVAAGAGPTEGGRAAPRVHGQRGARHRPHRGVHCGAWWTTAYLRWYAVKVFERDDKVMAELKLDG